LPLGVKSCFLLLNDFDWLFLSAISITFVTLRFLSSIHPRRNSYVSKTTQNNIIGLIGDFIREKLLAEVKEAKQFSILADEVTDVTK
jgi:hypothetical protein